VAGTPTTLALKLWVVSSFAWAVASSSTMLWHSFLKSWQKTRLFTLWSPALWSVSGPRWCPG
jgi:hypothetical protein